MKSSRCRYIISIITGNITNFSPNVTWFQVSTSDMFQKCTVCISTIFSWLNCLINLLWIAGKMSLTGLTWFPVSRPNSPRGTPSCFTIVFQHLIFKQNIWHIYHFKGHLSGYVLLDFRAATSITAGVGSGQVGGGLGKNLQHVVHGETDLFLPPWFSSLNGYRVLIGSEIKPRSVATGWN